MPPAGKVWIELEGRPKVKAAVRQVEKDFKRLGDSVKKISFGQVAALGGVTYALQRAIGEFANFDRSVREITTLLPELTEKQFQELSDSVIDLSVTYGQTIESMAKARYDAISAGFNTIAESATLLQTASKLAVGGVSTVAKTTDVLTSSLNAYGLEAEEAIYVSDILFETVRLGKTTVDELASGFGRAAAIAPTLGVTLVDLGAATATLTAQGLSTDEVMTALTATMSALLKPAEALQKALNRAGFESGKAAVEALGFTRALKLVTEGVGETELAARFPNIRAMRAIFPLTGKAMGKFEENLEALGNAAGSTETAFGKMSDGVAMRFDQMKTRLQALSIDVGEAMLPIGEAVAGTVETFTDLPKGLQTTTIAATGSAIAIATLAPLFKNLFNVGKALVPVIINFGVALRSLSLLRFGLIGAGIGAIIFLFDKLKRSGSGITTATMAMQEAVQAGEDLETAMNKAASGVSNLEEQITSLSIAQLEARLRELEQRKIEIGLGFQPLSEVDIPEIDYDFEPQKLEIGFTTTGIDETTQAINMWESETVAAFNKVDNEIALVTEQLKRLRGEVETAPVDTVWKSFQAGILNALPQILEKRKTNQADYLDYFLSSEMEAWETWQQLRLDFLASDREREEANLIARLDAWNENWRELEAGQQIFNAGMAKINAQFLTDQETQWEFFASNVSAMLFNTIGNFAISRIDQAFVNWYDRQTNLFAQFMITLLSEFTRTIARMIAQAKAAKLLQTLLSGGGGGFFGFIKTILFHEGGIVQKPQYYQTGDVVQYLNRGGSLIKPLSNQVIDFEPRGRDIVPAMLEPGEAVIPKKVVNRYPALIENLISGMNLERIPAQGFQAGGIINNNNINQGVKKTISPLMNTKTTTAITNNNKEGNVVNVTLDININTIDSQGVAEFISSPDFRQNFLDLINNGFLRLQAAGNDVEARY